MLYICLMAFLSVSVGLSETYTSNEAQLLSWIRDGRIGHFRDIFGTSFVTAIVAKGLGTTTTNTRFESSSLVLE